MKIFGSIVLSILAVMVNGKLEYCRSGFNPEKCEDVFFPDMLCNSGCDAVTCCGRSERYLQDTGMDMGTRNLRARQRNLSNGADMGTRNLRARQRT